MRFCLYDNKALMVLKVIDTLEEAVAEKIQRGTVASVMIHPYFTKAEYEAYPTSFRGVVGGRFYLVYSLHKYQGSTYGQVIVEE